MAFDESLQVTIPGRELFNEKTSEFVTTQDVTLTLKHSLISLSKWESKWKKPFLDSKTQKTREETIDYIRCMTVSPANVDPAVYSAIDNKTIAKVNAYIEDKMSATFVNHGGPAEGGAPRREIVTSELIYYWMIAYQIPWEAQKWHLNRLMMLIDVCRVKNSKPAPKSKKELATSYAALNRQRRAAMHTKG